MPVEQRAILADREHGAIQRRFGLRVELVDANDQVGLGRLGRLAERGHFRPVEADAILEQLAGCLPPDIGERAVDEERIAWKPGFAERDHVGVLFCRLVDPFQSDVEAGVVVKKGGRGLDGTEASSISHAFRYARSCPPIKGITKSLGRE